MFVFFINAATSCSPNWCVPISTSACYDIQAKKIMDIKGAINELGCAVCQQASHLSVCQKLTMESTFKAKPSVKLAYCNDKYLIIHSRGKPSHDTSSMSSIPSPPFGRVDDASSSSSETSFSTSIDYSIPRSSANQIPFNPRFSSSSSSSSSPTTCVSRTYQEGGHVVSRVPLSATELPTSLPSNNLKYFQKGKYPHNIEGYGLPEDAPVGVTTSGIPIYHMYTTVSTTIPATIVSNAVTSSSISDSFADCSVDKCSGNSGPDFTYRYKGDPYSNTPNECLYSPLDYQNVGSHPPLIGWAFDGFEIFGRHLFAASLGRAIFIYS